MFGWTSFISHSPPTHVCIVWFPAGLEQLKDREYLGTVHSIKVNADYAAAHFEDKIQLHMVCAECTLDFPVVFINTIEAGKLSNNEQLHILRKIYSKK